jgi:hypothetical protein
MSRGSMDGSWAELLYIVEMSGHMHNILLVGSP